MIVINMLSNQTNKWDGKLIPLEDYPNISEKCSDFPDDHPLKIASAIDNKAFLNFFESLLSKLQGIKGLANKINKIEEDKGNFNSYVSELKVAAFLKDRVDDLEILPSDKKGPDIRAKKEDIEFFVEVKLLDDLESKLFEEIHQIKSPYIVEVETKSLLTEEITALIESIKQKIERGECGKFSEYFADITIRNKSDYGIEDRENERTFLLKIQKELIKIDYEKARNKIFSDFYDKKGQLTNDKPTIWAIDLARWYIDEKDVKEIVYGSSSTDCTIFWKSYPFNEFIKSLYNTHLEKIGKALRRDSIAMHKYNLLPCLLYREPDGLFIMEESESLNGILLLQKEGERFSRLPNGYCKHKLPPFYYYPNPFVKDELYVPNMERLFE